MNKLKTNKQTINSFKKKKTYNTSNLTKFPYSTGISPSMSFKNNRKIINSSHSGRSEVKLP